MSGGGPGSRGSSRGSLRWQQVRASFADGDLAQKSGGESGEEGGAGGTPKR